MNAENLITEASARIIWGEEPSTVCSFLTSSCAENSWQVGGRNEKITDIRIGAHKYV
jgi:hypothetical protein